MTANAPGVILAIDQGTTGTTVLLLDAERRVVGRAYREIPQHYPSPGWVEHDPEDLFQSVIAAFTEAWESAGRPQVRAVGITNQRETTILWDRATGRAIGRAIVWQDRRTQDVCAALKQAGHEDRVRAVTGLVIDPYFSGTKIAWMLDRDPALRSRAERGELAFSTVDSYLVARLSGGRSHVIDVTNASRTLLLDLHSRRWSDEMCALFRVPRAVLPEVVASSGRLASVHGVAGIADGTPIAGIAGDQQAALYGQDCRAPGEAKCTYGTGAFLLMNVGATPVLSRNRLLTSVAWTLDAAGPTASTKPATTDYALEGSAFIAGALVQWLRDGLGIIGKASEIEALAASVPDSGGVTIIPALAGLGAPHWRPEARGLIAGITRGTTKAHLARAALEAIAFQIAELVSAMEADAGRPLTRLRVDGGAAANDLLMQLQADLLGVEVVRPAFLESTALGAGRLAGDAIGFWQTGTSDDARTGDRRFVPALPEPERAARRAVWQAVVAKA
ncbi:MAG TPA: glycerol kinase GlpK [Polyangia bacterium]